MVLTAFLLYSCGKKDDGRLALYSHWTNWTTKRTSVDSPISSHGSYIVVLQEGSMKLHVKEFDDGQVKTIRSFDMSYPDSHVFYSTPYEFDGETFIEFTLLDSYAKRETENIKISGTYRISPTTTGTRGRPGDTIIGGYLVKKENKVLMASDVQNAYSSEDLAIEYTAKQPYKLYLFVADYPE